MQTVKNIIISLRPWHWIKNLLVFSVLLFSGNLFNPDLFLLNLAVFIIFCFISSSIYLFNDIVDFKSDRLHPLKRKRPIASNLLSKKLAITLGIILMFVFTGLSFYLDLNLGYIIISYIFLNILYSFLLKKFMILDVFALSIGFFLRVLAGGVVLEIFPSYWLILCVFFLSLFFGFSKRYHEIRENNKVKSKYRNKQFLQIAIYIFATVSMIIYTLYSISSRTTEIFGDIRLIISLPFVLFGIIRYIYISLFAGKVTDPVTLVYKDKYSAINLGLWFLCIIYLIYFY